MISINNLHSIKTFGNSMEPLLKNNDIIYFEKKRFSCLQINDIIVFKKKKSLFTHRIIYRTKAFVITKGDNNRNSDGRVFPKNIIGTVSRIKRGNTVFDLETIYLYQSTLYFKEINAVKEAFKKSKIDFVFLKGLPLYLFYYKTHPRRIYGDCDILIDFSSLPKVFNIFKKLGYSYIYADRPWAIYSQRNVVKKYNFYKKKAGTYIVFDIHTALTFMIDHLGHLDNLYHPSYLRAFSQECMQYKHGIYTSFGSFPILSSSHAAVYFALHIFNHNFEFPFRYELLIRIIKNGVNYRKIATIIKKYDLQNFVFPAFFLLKKHFLKQLPNDFMQSIQPNNRIMKYLKKNILSKNIFNKKSQIEAGIERFLYSFFLSPLPFYRKLLVFFNFNIISSIIWIIYKKFIRLFQQSPFQQDPKKN